MNTNQFYIAVKINKDYDFILETNQYEVGQTLIASIKSEPPVFIEIKLNLIETLLPIMNFSMVESLLNAFEKLINNCKSQPQQNYLTYNTNGIMVSLMIGKVLLVMKRRFPRIETRFTQITTKISNIVW